MTPELTARIPTLITVITTAAIDSINPCAIGVLILMISVVLGSGKSVRRLLWLGFLYIMAVLVVYLLAGLGLLYFLAAIPLIVTETLSIFVAIILIIAGLLEIKDFFWYGKGFHLAISGSNSQRIKRYANNVSAPGVIFLGAFVSAVELPCTGAPYLAIITLLSQYFDFTAFLMLVVYNIVFVSPLIIVLLLVAGGLEIEKINKWKDFNKPLMRLAVGILLIYLSWLLILIANGTINLG
jgi:cytochrome c biogenesis protein CcdA